jgi:DNA-binding transcriptional MerR regulator
VNNIIKELRQEGIPIEECKRLAPIIAKRDNCIAELEKSVSILQQQIEKMLYNQPANNLEQKADAVRELRNKFGAMGRTEKNLLKFEVDYREQAKELKDKR